MALGRGKILTIYIMLSHPLSIVRRHLDFLPTRADEATAIKDVVDLLNHDLNLGLTPASQDYMDMQTLLSLQKIIAYDSGTKSYRIPTDPKDLAPLDGYDPIYGCPSGDEGASMYKYLPA